MGAHPFLTLTLFIAMFERDHGPLEYQRAYGAALKHLSLPYPTSPPRSPGAVVLLDLLWASGTSYFGRPAVPYVPGVQGGGVVERSESVAPGVERT